MHYRVTFSIERNSTVIAKNKKTNKTKKIKAKKLELKFVFHFGLELEFGFFLHP